MTGIELDDHTCGPPRGPWTVGTIYRCRCGRRWMYRRDRSEIQITAWQPIEPTDDNPDDD